MAANDIMNAEELLKKIFECMTELLEAKEFSKNVNLLTKLGCLLVNCERASFWFWDKDEKQYWTLAATDSGKIVIPEDTGIVGQVINSDKPVLCNDPYNEPFFNKSVDENTGFITKSILCIPVENTAGEVIGAYQAINKTDVMGNSVNFNSNDIERLSLAVVYCEKLLESYLLQNERLKDNDTGLKNKAAFFEYYNTKISSIAWKMDTCILVAGIDQLSPVSADELSMDLLLKATKAFKSNTNVDDLIARWDGNSLIAVLHQKKADEAIVVAEKIQLAFNQSVSEAYPGSNYSLSFGVHLIDTLFTTDEKSG